MDEIQPLLRGVELLDASQAHKKESAARKRKLAPLARALAEKEGELRAAEKALDKARDEADRLVEQQSGYLAACGLFAEVACVLQEFGLLESTRVVSGLTSYIACLKGWRAPVAHTGSGDVEVWARYKNGRNNSPINFTVKLASPEPVSLIANLSFSVDATHLGLLSPPAEDHLRRMIAAILGKKP